MNVKNRSGYHTAQVVLTSAFIAGIGLFIIYFLRGIYPFGSRNIAYYDMSQSFVPLYYRTYDVLHGGKSVFWDWHSGLGVSAIDTAGNFILSPFNLFFYLVKRDKILESMSFFLALKVCFSAGAMAFYSKKTYRNTEGIWHILFGILYGGCGFIMQYYSSIQLLDIVAFFPIIMYYTDVLLERKKYKGFILSVALGLIVNLYMMFQVMIFLVLYCAVKLCTDCKEKRDRRIAALGFCVLTALLLASVILLPNAIALLTSSRTEISRQSGEIHVIWRLFDRYFGNKLLMLYGCELPAAILLTALIFKKKERKTYIPWMLLLGVMILPIWFELINLAWHPGGYVDFPMRFGFIISFLFTSLAGRILDSGQIYVQKTDKRTEKMCHYGRLLGIAVLPFVVIALYYFLRGYRYIGIRDLTAYSPYYSILLMLVISFGIFVLSHKRKHVPFMCMVLILAQFGLGWYCFLAPENMYSSECMDSIVKRGEIVRAMVEDETDNDSIDRIKDVSNSLNANYPYIIQKAAISNWTWGGKETTQNVLKKLGYSTNYTRLLDSGGTIFTDAFFNIREIITFNSTDNFMYTVKEQSGEYYLADANYRYPFGIMVNKDISFGSIQEDSTAIDVQNELFAKISGSEENLINKMTLREVLSDRQSDGQDNMQYQCRIPVDGRGVLYLEVADEEAQLMIYINDEPLIIPDLEKKENVVYPGYFVNGLVECGYFEDELVMCTIVSNKPVEDGVTFGVLNADLLFSDMEVQNDRERNIRTGKRGMQIEIESEGDNNLLLPLQYDANCVIKVNGEKVEALAAVEDAFLMIPLERGNNIVTLYFEPIGIKGGIILSIAGIFFFVFIIWKGNAVFDNKAVALIARYVYLLCLSGLMLYIYIFPFVRTIIAYVQYKL